MIPQIEVRSKTGMLVRSWHHPLLRRRPVHVERQQGEGQQTWSASPQVSEARRPGNGHRSRGPPQVMHLFATPPCVVPVGTRQIIVPALPSYRCSRTPVVSFSCRSPTQSAPRTHLVSSRLSLLSKITMTPTVPTIKHTGHTNTAMMKNVTSRPFIVYLTIDRSPVSVARP